MTTSDKPVVALDNRGLAHGAAITAPPCELNHTEILSITLTLFPYVSYHCDHSSTTSRKNLWSEPHFRGSAAGSRGFVTD